MEGLGCEQLMATSEGLDAPKFTSEGIKQEAPNKTQPNPAQSVHFKEEQITDLGMKAANIKAAFTRPGIGEMGSNPSQPMEISPRCALRAVCVGMCCPEGPNLCCPDPADLITW